MNSCTVNLRNKLKPFSAGIRRYCKRKIYTYFQDYRNGGMTDTKPAFSFIPDMSGFTQFVTETEINHSRHIIQELLELLIDSNELKLELVEIEGDALFFCRFGLAPDAGSMIGQAKKNVSRVS